MWVSDYRALSFDCYGTLIDWESGILNFLRRWSARAGVAVDDEALLETFAAVESREESRTPRKLYPAVLESVLDGIAARFGITASAVDRAAFGQSVAYWPAFPDSVAALAELKRHFKLIILSNVDRASFARSNVKLGVKFDLIVTAEDVGSYKPNARNFRTLTTRLALIGIEQQDLLHVAQSLFHDIEPASKMDLRTAWINRRQGKPGHGATKAPKPGVEADFEFPSLKAFVDAVNADRQG